MTAMNSATPGATTLAAVPEVDASGWTIPTPSTDELGDELVHLATIGGRHLPVEVDDALGIAIQIGKGLAAAHGRSIVHRDVKPANIIVTEDGSVKVTDFGIARRLKGSARTIDLHGKIQGSPLYMSPEVLSGDVDNRWLDRLTAVGGHIPEPDPIALLVAAVEHGREALVADVRPLGRAERAAVPVDRNVAQGGHHACLASRSSWSWNCSRSSQTIALVGQRNTALGVAGPPAA